ncbi:ABC transporter, partial [Citrobacter braakii]
EQAKPIKKALAAVEADVARLTEEKQALEQALAGGGLSPAELADNGRRLKAVSEALEAAETRWLELADQLEALGAS